MLRLEYANCLSPRVGPHGLDADSLAVDSEWAARAAKLNASLSRTRGSGWERWRELARDPMRTDHVTAVNELVETRRDRFSNLVVLGIGGSALGNIALHATLNPPTYNLLPDQDRPGPRLFVIDNVDPANFRAIIDFFSDKRNGGLQRTLFNVISKSGETAETAAQFMIVRQMLIDTLGEEAHAQNIVAITDEHKGTMRAICDREGYATLPVPDGVGGRFSALSPVGLFSAAMCGIDINALLDGAHAMDVRCAREDLTQNPAAMLATLLVRLGLEKNKTNHVLMPYCNGLYLLADWYRQLWAESLGKRVDTSGAEVFAGFTPIKSLGATDQHSQIQLYREGPNDKVVGFIEVTEFDNADVDIPGGLGVDALSYLERTNLSRLLNAEKRATEYALTESQRPNFTIRIPRVDAHAVGEFLQLWMVATAYAGLLLNIDAYDQPAVETGKLATFGLMGRPGFESYREATESTLTETEWVV